MERKDVARCDSCMDASYMLGILKRYGAGNSVQMSMVRRTGNEASQIHAYLPHKLLGDKTTK